MKAIRLLTPPLIALSVAAWSGVVLADTADANCEVRKGGETKQGASGPCTFSQRQGYVSIDLRNGNRIELSPGAKPNHFKDEKGKTVVLTVTENEHEYKWDEKKLIVRWNTGSSSAAPSSGGGGTGSVGAERREEFKSVCGAIVKAQNLRYRCTVVDFFTGNQKTRTILQYPDMKIELTWRPGGRIGLQFEGMVPMEARYSTSEGETNFVFEDKTYFYYSDKEMARQEYDSFRN